MRSITTITISDSEQCDKRMFAQEGTLNRRRLRGFFFLKGLCPFFIFIRFIGCAFYTVTGITAGALRRRAKIL